MLITPPSLAHVSDRPHSAVSLRPCSCKIWAELRRPVKDILALRPGTTLALRGIGTQTAVLMMPARMSGLVMGALSPVLWSRVPQKRSSSLVGSGPCLWQLSSAGCHLPSAEAEAEAETETGNGRNWPVNHPHFEGQRQRQTEPTGTQNDGSLDRYPSQTQRHCTGVCGWEWQWLLC